MCATLAISAWSRPCACWRPASVFSRSCSFPRTLTNTRACRRSGLVSTAVTVTNPMRGSFSPSAIRAERISRRASLTLRMRSPATLLPQYVVRGNNAAFETHAFRKLTEHVTLQVVGRVFERTEVPADQGSGQRRALPELVMVGLGDRRAEALSKLGLQ